MSASNCCGENTEIVAGGAQTGLRVQLTALEARVVSGADTGLALALNLPSMRIGSAADNDLVLSDRAVSRHHAEVRLTPEGLLLRDLGSTNGTFINEVRISEAYVPANAQCRLGYSVLLLEERSEQRPAAIAAQNRLGELVGGSERMRELYALIRAVAPTPTTVHLYGESGSGKEAVARTLHIFSGRSGPFVVFDASVTDAEMVRNDLFGHVKGAFTGASGAREGAFRQAHTGTLFIDEIGELPLELQPRLLRVLESREVTPIGSDKATRVDVRVITATHRDLAQMVQEGRFRADLFYRLAVLPLELPALREIRADLPLLVEHLCAKLQLNLRLAPAALAALQSYPWPGNVRELRNVLERTALLCPDREAQPADLRLPKSALAPALTNAPALPASLSADARAQLKDLERQMIVEALQQQGGNKAAVARELGIPLSTLKRRIKEYRIDDAEE